MLDRVADQVHEHLLQRQRARSAASADPADRDRDAVGRRRAGRRRRGRRRPTSTGSGWPAARGPRASTGGCRRSALPSGACGSRISSSISRVSALSSPLPTAGPPRSTARGWRCRAAAPGDRATRRRRTSRARGCCVRARAPARRAPGASGPLGHVDRVRHQAVRRRPSCPQRLDDEVEEALAASVRPSRSSSTTSFAVRLVAVVTRDRWRSARCGRFGNASRIVWPITSRLPIDVETGSDRFDARAPGRGHANERGACITRCQLSWLSSPLATVRPVSQVAGAVRYRTPTSSALLVR